MPLVFFPETPKGVCSSTTDLPMQGKDTETGEYVECRVTAKALVDRCGARGPTDEELLRSFKEHRARIEDTRRRKYAADKVEREPDRIVVRLDVADL